MTKQAETNIDNIYTIFSLRIMILILGISVPIYYFVVQIVSPESKDSISLRLTYTGIALSLFILTFVSKRIEQYTHELVMLLSLLLVAILHYFSGTNDYAIHYLLVETIVAMAIPLVGRSKKELIILMFLISIFSFTTVLAFPNSKVEKELVFLFLIHLGTISTSLLQFQRIALLNKISDKARLQNTIFNNMMEGLVLQSKDGSIIQNNQAALNILGLTQDQLIGRTSMDPRWRSVKEDLTTFPGEEHPAMISLKTGLPVNGVVMGLQLPNKQELRWIKINAAPLIRENESEPYAVIATFSDITQDKKNLELITEKQAALAAATNLANVGELSAGIAHEINNPLTVILGRSEKNLAMAEAKNLTLEKSIESFEKIHSMSLRIMKIIKGLKTLSRDGERDTIEDYPVQKVLDDALDFCSERFRINYVELKLQIDSHLMVKCSSVQLTQVLLNLMNNAFDAVKYLNEKWIHVTAKNEGPYLYISVSDSGPLIPDEIAYKIMTPFFTTKEVGKGTGLGLSLSKSIIEKHRGTLTLDRSKNNNTFVIKIPIS